MIPEIELKSIADIENFQAEKLKYVLKYVSEYSPFYNRLFKKHKISVSEIHSLDDLKRLPCTTKDDLQLFNEDFLCVPKDTIIDYVTTSGTLGEPVTFALTDKDLDRLAYNEAISLACTGIEKGSVVQLMTTVDRRFMAGLAYFLGLRKLGASTIRVGSGVPELQWDSILKFKPSHLIVVPSFLLKLIQYADENNIDLNATSVKGAICIGEPIRNEDFSLNTLGQSISSQWNIDLFSTYASTEMSTAFTECEYQNGGHLHPELIITEILDSDNRPVEDGSIGELVITTLGVEGMPLVRFKTGDLLKAHWNSCKCGRNTLRLGPVTGRKQQMIKYKGTTLYPPAMQNVLNQFNEIKSFVIEISSNSIGTDEILLKIAAVNSDTSLIIKIKDHFRAKLRVTPQIEFHSEEDIHELRFPKMSRKPVLVIDKR